MNELFFQFGIILLVVLGVSIVMRLLRQPLIIGYILAGILVGPVLFNLIGDSGTFNIFAEMGISFLLFIVGLHLSPKVVKEVGKVSVTTGLGQIAFTSIFGFLISKALGYDNLTAIYIAVAITFSSTIIIMKLLSDKDALDKLYGKVSIGFLLVQDLVAILALIIVTSLSQGAGTGEVLIGLLIKAVILFAILTPITIYVLPKVSGFFARSQEFLFIFAIAFGFGLSLLFVLVGFSIEVGALVAGIMLSMSPYAHEISSRLKPLRDFFIISFFIVLGSQMTFGDIGSLIFPAIILSVFVLIGNPIIVMSLMGMLGYSKKTGFMAGLTVAQISEFSLILIALGTKVGAIPAEILSLITLVGLITIAGSTYMIIYSDWIFDKIAWALTIFERKNVKEKSALPKEFDYVLLGYDRIGYNIIKSFEKMKKKFVVIDYDPDIVNFLRKRGINALYGDLDDPELLEELNLTKAHLIVSTIPDQEINELLLDYLERTNSKAATIFSTKEIQDAFNLYEMGASYVVLPYFLGGMYAEKIIEIAKHDKKVYRKEKEKEIRQLKKRFKDGYRKDPTNED